MPIVRVCSPFTGRSPERVRSGMWVAEVPVKLSLLFGFDPVPQDVEGLCYAQWCCLSLCVWGGVPFEGPSSLPLPPGVPLKALERMRTQDRLVLTMESVPPAQAAFYCCSFGTQGHTH